MLRHQALGHTMERHSSPIRRVMSMSTRVVQWSPGLREKGQRETAEAWRVADIQTPSIGDFPSQLPCLKVIGQKRVGCAARIDSWRPRVVVKEDLFFLNITIHIGH